MEHAAVPYMLAGIELWIVSPEDLILSKLDWARDTRSELQLRDVRHLLAAAFDGAVRQPQDAGSAAPLSSIGSQTRRRS